MLRTTNKWVSVIVVSALALAVTGAASAQGRGPGGPGGRGPMGGSMQVTAATLPVEQMAKTLSLTQEQKDAISVIQSELRAAIQKAMPAPQQGTRPDPATMKANQEKIAALETAASVRVLALLTDTQKATLTALLQQVNDFRVVGFPQQAAADLALTSTQLTQIHAIAEKARAAEKALMDQMATSTDPRALGQKIQAIRTQANTDALAVLTDAQRATLAKFAQRGPRDGGPGEGGPRDGGPAPDGGPGMPPPPEQ